MTSNDKTRRAGRVCHCVELCIAYDCNPTESPRINQAICLPSATRYYLKRYRDDIQPHAEAGNDDALIMVTMCDALLDSADMLEGVTGER
jgi:hypothetical protein